MPRGIVRISAEEGCAEPSVHAGALLFGRERLCGRRGRGHSCGCAMGDEPPVRAAAQDQEKGVSLADGVGDAVSVSAVSGDHAGLHPDLWDAVNADALATGAGGRLS